MTEDMMATISFTEWLELKTQRDQLYAALSSIIDYDDEAVEEGAPSRLTQGEYDNAQAALSLARGEIEVPSPAVRRALRRFWNIYRKRQEAEGRSGAPETMTHEGSTEQILNGIVEELLPEAQRIVAEIGYDQFRANITAGLAKMAERPKGDAA